ncbi:MAG: efflux RND transporter periplasmic adaptor subunit [bacterium]|nr:efflux RND transporter periplasmic adaptor subunit [bacterium]
MKKTFFKKVWERKWILIIAVSVLIGILFFVFRNKEDGVVNIKAERGDVILEIDIVGKVKPSRNLDMAFVQGGKISQVNFSVGNEVRTGQVLAALDNGELVAQLRQAEASLAIQQAKLDELVKGTRSESLAVKQSELAKARVDLANNYSAILNVLNDAYVKADDAVTKQTDPLFSDDNSSNPDLTFTSSDNQATIDSEWQRRVVGEELEKWAKNLSNWQADLSEAEKDQALIDAKDSLSEIQTFLGRLSIALQKAIDLSSSVLESYNTNINTARVNVNLAMTTVTNQQQTIASQKSIVDRIEKEYALLVSGNTQEQIAAQEAQVAQARANVNYALAQLEKTYLRAPFNGRVTRTLLDIGSIVGVNQSVISLIGAGHFEIEANVAESDVAKIKIGDKAKVTLDAYGDEPVFEATVVSIDLAATIIEGVATYKTVLQFNQDDNKILAGLTANVDIAAEKREGVIFVPTRSITEKDGQKMVKVLNDGGKEEEREITVGLRGSDGRTEILSGLAEGEAVTAK